MKYEQEKYESIELSIDEIKPILVNYVKEISNMNVSKWVLWIEDRKILFTKDVNKKKKYDNKG